MDVTRTAVLLPAFKLLDQRFRLTFVSPPVRYMRPQRRVAVSQVVLVRDDRLVTRTPQAPQRDRVLMGRRYTEMITASAISGESPCIPGLLF